MRIRRRDLLLGFTSLGILGVPACSDDETSPAPSTPGSAVGDLPLAAAVFAHGVASGDPLADRVILWTRVTSSAPSVAVQWVIAKDAQLREVVARGEAMADVASDHTVKVDPTGLAAGTTYYYAFAALEGRSVVGRTRTLPTGDVARLRFAITSCANFNNGYFNAYGRIADRNDLDVWIHLGDYIYEYADGVYGAIAADRPHLPPGEVLSLDDYRRRYACYHADPDLQEIHRQHPLIAVWDDHETANDAWVDGAENHGAGEGPWDSRKRNATRAFLEWLPIRVASTELPPKIWRAFSFGNLMDLMMIDTRLIARARQVGATDVVAAANKGTPAEWADPSRLLLGDEQEGWLKGELSSSKQRGTAWRMLGNQVILAPTTDPRDGKIVSTDFWDGYQATRTRLFDHLTSEKIDNFVVLTGDIHTSWALDIPASSTAQYDPATGAGSLGVELVCPAVTSQGLEGDPLSAAAPGLLKNANKHLFFSEVTRKGYVLVDVTRERIQAEWYFVDDFKVRVPGESLAAAFTCASGSAHLVAAEGPTPPRTDAPPRVS
jgi:alkaline phosphatase D